MHDSSKYDGLNRAVQRVFYDGRNYAKPTFLALEDAVAEELASLLQVTVDALPERVGSIVEPTISWGATGNVYGFHTEQLAKWREAGMSDTPPFLGLLFAFSLSAERMRGDEEFASHNYYQRFVEILGLGEDARSNAVRRLHASARHTEAFWDALNTWLVDHGYAYGQPTASHLNSHARYVEYAVSQSLIRDADRQSLSRMLDGYGLSRGQRMSTTEISSYISSWMIGPSGPSRHLKNIWANKDLKFRVVEEALGILEKPSHLAGSALGASQKIRRLSWLVEEFDDFPRVGVQLHLSTPLLSEPVGALTMTDVQGALRAKSLVLERFSTSDLGLISPRRKLDIAALLATENQFVSDNGYTFLRSVRTIFPLCWRDDIACYQECTQVLPFVRHAVVCHESWSERVDAYLASYAAPGFTKVPNVDGRPLPRDWVMYRNVMIAKVCADQIESSLQVLIPSAADHTFNYLGGLRLAGSIWLTLAPPILAISAEAAFTTLRLTSDHVPEITISADGVYGDLFRDGRLFKDGQNFTLSIDAAPRPLTDSISFRSADYALPRGYADITRLSYLFGSEAGISWGTSASQGSAAVVLCGLNLSGVPVPDEPPEHILNVARISGIQPEGMTADHFEISDTPIRSHICILRGVHCINWNFGEDEGKCTDCGQHFFRDAWIKEAKKREGQRSDHGFGVAPPPVLLSDEAAASLSAAQTGVSGDGIYDAFCYFGSGGAELLTRLLSAGANGQVAAWKAFRALIDLSLLDVELAGPNGQPKRWSVPPPALTRIANDRVYLSGFRSANLIHAISKRLEGFGSVHLVSPNDGAPSSHFWTVKELSTTDIAEIVRDVSDPLGRPLRVDDCPASRIASVLPETSRIYRIARSISVGRDVEAERFDALSGAWTPGELDRPGAYRIFVNGTRYVYFDGERSSEVSFEIAKLASARLARTFLHEYNSDSQQFISMLGCEPPGLYRRALVSASGVLPTKRQGRTSFHQVDQLTASFVLNKLYG
jgi:hypothetical protein